MKRYGWIFLLLTMFVFCSYRDYLYKHGTNVLRPGFDLVSVDHSRLFAAFMDNETYKIGFLYNQSNLCVAIPPTYDNALNTGFLLYPVMKNGKWGVFDLGGRFYDNNRVYNPKMPIIPCKYNNVKVIDNFVVICDGKRIDVRELGYERF